MTLTLRLLALSEAYCEAKGIALATLSGYALRDSRTLPRLRNGGSITLRNCERVIEWISKNWPTDKAKPDGLLLLKSPDEICERGAA
ncbi:MULTISPECIES: hypothetical protein [Komagataeibacter]|uniref:hypothetical protein n=1 Tax=Komagataeibacter TaxID=1434011 RepID=UPI001046CE3D|nr:hypothetical protein [Komagataeibacter saccharivorans]QBL93117.1 hypothetical protein KSAC_08760 [Komagataeibacter saccharivorans]